MRIAQAARNQRLTSFSIIYRYIIDIKMPTTCMQTELCIDENLLLSNNNSQHLHMVFSLILARKIVLCDRSYFYLKTRLMQLSGW